MRGKSIKKASYTRKDALRPEYRREDLGKGVRGKYHRAYIKGTNLVLLKPDIAAAFPTAEAVYDALRSLLKVAKRSGRLTRRSTGAAKAAR
jgi:hypothetical protein